MPKDDRLTTGQEKSFEYLFQSYGKRYQLYAILTIGIGTIATILSSTNINVAIPNIMGAFGIGQDVAQWLASGYLAAATVTMLMTAWAVESFGIRNTFVIAMLVFLASSLLGAISASAEVMILARVIQGATSGFFLPLSMMVMGRLFPPEKQGLAMGLFGILAVMAPAFGPYIGGILIDAFNWRYAFYMVIPMGLISLPMALLFLPERESQAETRPLDWPGVILLALAISLLLLGFSKGQAKGWDSDYILSCFALMSACAIAFIAWQYHCAHPLLQLELFKNREFSLTAIVTLVFGAGLYASFYTTPLFLQTIQGLNATQAGFVLMPGGIVLALIFPLTGHLSDRVSPRLMIGAGLMFLALSFWLMVAADSNTGLWFFAGWIILGRIGLAVVMPSLNVASLTTLPRELLTRGSSTVNFLRQLGGALGVNLSTLVLQRRTALHTDAITATQHAGNTQTLETLNRLVEPLASTGVDSLTQLPMAVWLMTKEFYRQGLTLGFQDTFAISTLVVLLALIPTWLLRRPAPQAAPVAAD